MQPHGRASDGRCNHTAMQGGQDWTQLWKFQAEVHEWIHDSMIHFGMERHARSQKHPTRLKALAMSSTSMMMKEATPQKRTTASHALLQGSTEKKLKRENTARLEVQPDTEAVRELLKKRPVSSVKILFKPKLKKLKPTPLMQSAERRH